MRIFGTILLTFILLSKTLYGIFWQVNFRLNQQEIARMECINKNRPELHCNGKCYLAKQLQKAEQQLDDKKQASSRSQEQLKWTESDLFACAEIHISPIIHRELDVQTSHLLASINFYDLDVVDPCFHPPCS
ncbi:MAG: hypothetical protein ACKOXP_03945 [Flavobacteriales bacterium]